VVKTMTIGNPDNFVDGEKRVKTEMMMMINLL